MNQQKVTQAVETICEMGCTSVNAIITSLESGNTVKGFEHFEAAEITALTNELKAIMKVYENKK